ncbi:MaoC family dehydratase N-terminal domain-containing protein [Actinomadura vinacea]|uniref:MaoC family dehydratase N-terminal domain-containing protein n=1 Tax=Actinomadura vinacea TaxID=115336 RepID=A0ABP5WAP2_9ACTN
MAIDAGAIGTELPIVESTMEARRLRFFAKAIGETDPVYSDLEAARAAGHPDLPVPPTFLFGIELERPEPFGFLTDLGVDLRRILHGTQSFVYHSTAHAGDTLIARPRIADVYAKKGGALEFVVKETAVAAVDGSPIADLSTVIVVRSPEATA